MRCAVDGAGTSAALRGRMRHCILLLLTMSSACAWTEGAVRAPATDASSADAAETPSPDRVDRIRFDRARFDWGTLEVSTRDAGDEVLETTVRLEAADGTTRTAVHRHRDRFRVRCAERIEAASAQWEDVDRDGSTELYFALRTHRCNTFTHRQLALVPDARDPSAGVLRVGVRPDEPTFMHGVAGPMRAAAATLFATGRPTSALR